jgi:ABC-2 type transport system ATP-binding protein
MPAVTVRDLSRRFGAFVAVDQVSFDVEQGEIFGFLGSNGAGKSTTIRMLCGLLKPTSGTALVGGIDVSRDPEAVKLRIGYMSQRFSLYELLTVEENLTFFGGLYGLDTSTLATRRDFALEMAGLKGWDRTLTRDLAGGWRQRLALGCAILHEPPILFLDEPTSGVDPISRRLFWELIHSMASRGVTVLITTHFMDEAEFCGRIAFINGGRLAALDTPSALRRNAVEEDLFDVAGVSLRGAAARLSAIEGVVLVSYFGDRLHVFCRRGDYTAERLAEAMRRGGLSAGQVSPIAPAFEDVFIRLAQKREGGKEAA